MPSAAATAPRFTFAIKLAAAAALVLLADLLFFRQWVGANLGLFALGWLAALLLAVPAVRRSRLNRAALLAAAFFALLLLDDPSLLGWTLYWIALSLAVLLPRSRHFGNAATWGGRLALHWCSSAVAALFDAVRLVALRRRPGGRQMRRLLAAAALPLAGGMMFLLLFAAANPLIEQAFASLPLPALDEFTAARMAFWLLVLAALWPSLRPRPLVARAFSGAVPSLPAMPGVSVTSVTASLLLFNLLFAVQNLLDITFLWSGAPLPDGMTLAAYAHRGAYPLIATALLAGLFVLVTLRPGSATAASPLIRALVLAWIAQNLLLVASSILRTIDYIGVYSLTRLRIAALAWMALVAVGLVLICWRLFAGRSSRWLINANAAAAALLLALAAVVDLGAIAAAWNVRHAREVGGRGAGIDLCYLNRLGASALVPLAELEVRPLPLVLTDRVRWLRVQAMADLAERQSHWPSWTWRGARRLDEARAILGDQPRPLLPAPDGRACDGSRLPPAPPLPPPPPVAVPMPPPAPPTPQPVD